MRNYYCAICKQWFRAKAQMDIQHEHRGYEPAFMSCEPIGLKTPTSHIGAKAIYETTAKARWRAILIHIETGYSQTPSWGHEAGGWIHYTYESMRDCNNNFIEAKTKADLLSKLKEIPEIREDNYFH